MAHTTEMKNVTAPTIGRAPFFLLGIIYLTLLIFAVGDPVIARILKHYSGVLVFGRSYFQLYFLLAWTGGLYALSGWYLRKKRSTTSKMVVTLALLLLVGAHIFCISSYLYYTSSNDLPLRGVTWAVAGEHVSSTTLLHIHTAKPILSVLLSLLGITPHHGEYGLAYLPHFLITFFYFGTIIFILSAITVSRLCLSLAPIAQRSWLMFGAYHVLILSSFVLIKSSVDGGILNIEGCVSILSFVGAFLLLTGATLPYQPRFWMLGLSIVFVVVSYTYLDRNFNYFQTSSSAEYALMLLEPICITLCFYIVHFFLAYGLEYSSSIWWRGAIFTLSIVGIISLSSNSKTHSEELTRISTTKAYFLTSSALRDASVELQGLGLTLYSGYPPNGDVFSWYKASGNFLGLMSHLFTDASCDEGNFSETGELRTKDTLETSRTPSSFFKTLSFMPCSSKEWCTYRYRAVLYQCLPRQSGISHPMIRELSARGVSAALLRSRRITDTLEK